MADVFLVNSNQLSPTDYDWDAAFNNQEFVNYIKKSSIYPYTYYDNAHTFIEPYEFYSNMEFKNRVHNAYFNICFSSIGSHAFDGCPILSSLYFSANMYAVDDINIRSIITEIGYEAFANCPSLYMVSFATNRKYGARAFYNCSSLYMIYMGSMSNAIGPLSETYWLNDIGDECFALSSSVSQNLYLRNNASYVNRIGKSAFEHRNFDMYPGVGQNICKFIDDYAFKNTNRYYSAIFNAYASKSEYKNFDLRLTLGKNIFQGCSTIYTIKCYGVYSIYSDTFGSDVKSTLRNMHTTNDNNGLYSTFKTDIKSHAFENYSQLNYVYMYNIGVIEEYAFANCTSLNGFYTHIGELLCDEIQDYAFYGCTELSSYYCNKRVWQLNEYVNSSNLRRVKLTGQHIFSGCDTLKTVEIYNCGDIPSYLFNEFSALNRVYLCGIPDSMSKEFGYRCSINIGERCFYNDSALNEAYAPYINKISEQAFYNCASLKYFDIGNKLCSEVGVQAFENCIDLSKIIFNEKFDIINDASDVTLKICESAFKGCDDILEAYLYNVSYIGNDAFLICDNLESLYLRKISSVPQLINFGGFTSNSSLSIHVPMSLYSNFIIDSYWSELSNFIVAET